MGIYNLPKFQVPIYFGLGEESDTKMSLTSLYLYETQNPFGLLGSRYFSHRGVSGHRDWEIII